MVYKTLLGSTHLLQKSPFDAATLRVKVTSKGGTTQAAMDVFSKAKFDQLIKKCFNGSQEAGQRIS